MSNKLFNVFNRKVSESDFIKIFSSIYEHSEWVPENIIKNNSVLPDTIENLGLRMKEEVDKASNEKKLELLCLHPELGIKKNSSKKLTLSSQNEQKSAGLDQCSDEEFSILSEYNKLYREKFKFPFIIAVSGLNRSQIINQIKIRVENNYNEEFITAINEVHKIAKIRLDNIFL